MFLGHIGLGFAGKSVEEKMPSWLLIVAVMVPDLMSALFGIFGLKDKSVFLSHSLLMTLVFCLISAQVIFLIYHSFSAVLLFSGLILSHWICDFISWPLEVLGINYGINIFSANSAYGLGLYKTIPGALISEFSLLALGLGLYIFKRRKNKMND
jgi:hypothetical protein